MRRLASGALLAIAVAAGCAGGEERKVGLEDLPQLVLQPDDLGSSFLRFDEGRLARADLGGADPVRFGRQGGWKARYRATPADASGPLVIESRLDLFEAASGAEQHLDAYAEEHVLEEVEPVGDEAVATTVTQRAIPDDVRFYTVAWRQANVAAAVTVQGFEGEVELEDAVALARAIEERIDRAAAGEELSPTPSAAATGPEPRLVVVSSEPPSIEGAGFAPDEAVQLTFSFPDRTVTRETRANGSGVFAFGLHELSVDRCGVQATVVAAGESGSSASAHLPALQCPPAP